MQLDPLSLLFRLIGTAKSRQPRVSTETIAPIRDIVLGEAHLQHVLEEYCFQYFNRSRAHQGLEQRVPVPSGNLSSADGAKLVAWPGLGGLHHAYRWAA